MRIYRGPSTKEFLDPLTEEVDSKDLSGSLKPWTDRMDIRVNITKDITERQAVAYLVFEEADVVSLYQALVQGWKEKAHTFEKVKEKVSSFQEALRDIRRAASYAEFKGEKESLSQITSIVNDALEKSDQ